MRTAYHDQLDDLSSQLGEMCGLAGAAMERATQALLQADLVLAEQVITDHEQISALSARAEEAAFVLLALQAPVAGDLRAIVSSETPPRVRRSAARTAGEGSRPAIRVPALRERLHPAFHQGDSEYPQDL